MNVTSGGWLHSTEASRTSMNYDWTVIQNKVHNSLLQARMNISEQSDIRHSHSQGRRILTRLLIYPVIVRGMDNVSVCRALHCFFPREGQM